MRIYGDAKWVSTSELSIQVGATYENSDVVTRLEVGLEGELCHITVHKELEAPKHYTYLGFPVEVQWDGAPNIQCLAERVRDLGDKAGKQDKCNCGTATTPPAPRIRLTTESLPVDTDAGGPGGFCLA